MAKRVQAIYGVFSNWRKFPLRLAIFRTKQRISSCNRHYADWELGRKTLVSYYENWLLILQAALLEAVSNGESFVYINEVLPTYLDNLEVK